MAAQLALAVTLSYIATSLDELPLLFFFYTRARKERAWQVTLAYFAGTFVLLAAGMLGGMGLQLALPPAVLRWIGLVPLLLGLRTLLSREEEDDESNPDKEKGRGILLTVLLITLSLGVDDIAVYVPLFTAYPPAMTGLAVLVVLVCTAISCLTGYHLTRIRPLRDWINRRGNLIEGAVFIAVGLYLLLR